MVVDGGPWRGISFDDWLARFTRPLTAPVEEERAGGVSDGAEALPVSPAPSLSSWSEAELREIYGK